MSKVSIVIPFYNAGDHLAEAMQSTLAQKRPDVEISVVDDGSPDATALRCCRKLRGRERELSIRQTQARRDATMQSAKRLAGTSCRWMRIIC